MKILGHVGIKARTESVNLGELEDGTALVIELKAPRLNAITTLDAELDAPAAPQAPAGDVLRDERGRVQKDEAGRPITTRNERDPAYLKALEEHGELEGRHNRAKTLGMLLECIGGQIETAAKLEDYGEGKPAGLVDYYDAVWLELEAFGIDLVAINRLTNAAMRLAGLADESTGRDLGKLEEGQRRTQVYWELRLWELFPDLPPWPLPPGASFSALAREEQVLLLSYAALRDSEEHEAASSRGAE